jgi:hypothetical protein
MLCDQVSQQTKKCQQAVLSRQQLEDQMKDVDNLVKECEDSTDSVIGLSAPIPAKIEKLKVNFLSSYFMKQNFIVMVESCTFMQDIYHFLILVYMYMSLMLLLFYLLLLLLLIKN